MYEYLDRRYAKALYDVAITKDRVNKYIHDLSDIVELIDQSADIKQVIRHPEITVKEKKNFFIKLLKGKIDEDLLTFILILVEKDRILYLREKLAELKKLDLEARGSIVATVQSAVPLKDYQRKKLIESLMNRYNKQIILEETIDPQILGGIVIKVGDDLIDGSLRSTVDDLRQNMFSTIEVKQNEN